MFRFSPKKLEYLNKDRIEMFIPKLKKTHNFFNLKDLLSSSTEFALSINRPLIYVIMVDAARSNAYFGFQHM